MGHISCSSACTYWRRMAHMTKQDKTCVCPMTNVTELLALKSALSSKQILDWSASVCMLPYTSHLVCLFDSTTLARATSSQQSHKFQPIFYLINEVPCSLLSLAFYHAYRALFHKKQSPKNVINSSEWL